MGLIKSFPYSTKTFNNTVVTFTMLLQYCWNKLCCMDCKIYLCQQLDFFMRAVLYNV